VFISTDRAITSPIEKKYKDMTTVAFDIGIMHYNDMKLMFFGTPGQQRLFYFIPILMRQCEYLLFLVDSSSLASVYRARVLYDRFFRDNDFHNFLILANKSDIRKISNKDIAEILIVDVNKVVDCVALSKSSCLHVIGLLLNKIFK